MTDNSKSSKSDSGKKSREEEKLAKDSEELEGSSISGEDPSTESVETENPADPEAELARWRDLAMRNQADLENYRKRMAREKSDAVQYANASLLRGLLPVLDNFEMGLQAARAEGEDSIIFQGMEMVRRQIEDFLREEGVETIESIGSEFDPNQHEAVQQEHSDEVPEGLVISELRRGYRLKDRLLRAANVVISKGASENTDETAEAEASTEA